MTQHAIVRRVALLLAGVVILGTVGALPALAAPATITVTVSGSVATIGDQADDTLERAFRVADQGYLALDFSAVPAALQKNEELSLRVTVPDSLDLGATAESRFLALQQYSQSASLRVTSLVDTPAVKAMINTVPAFAGVHTVYAVLVTPSNVVGDVPGTGQTAAGVAAAVDYVDSFWSGESAGRIGFELAGTVPHYKSRYSCANLAGSLALWNEAEAKARIQLDYPAGANVHLSLFFPDGTGSCSGGGLGDVGTSINAGGRTWSVGSDSAQGKRILAHELGHNLSFGHANWLDCYEAEPYLGASGFDADCSNVEYGDRFDTMGEGTPGKTGGSISSPNAIRSGLWTAADYDVAPTGTTSYEITSVGSNAGKRAVVVEDSLGLNFFVELRTFVGDDAQFAGGAGTCSSGPCVPATPGVRILTLEKKAVNGAATFKGYWGDDTHLLGRRVGGVLLRDYKQGQVFRSQAGGGVTVTVDQISATTATVTVVRPPNDLAADTSNGNPFDAEDPKGAWVTRTHGGFDNFWRVGDTVTALLGDEWEADSFSFQWYRWGGSSAIPIDGATGQSYTLRPEDSGTAVRVTVTGSVGSSSQSVTLPETIYSGFGVSEGRLAQGSVAITRDGALLTSKLRNWTTAGASYGYQWFRGATAIENAIAPTYELGAADTGETLTVVVTASRTGFQSVTAASNAIADGSPAPLADPVVTATLAPLALTATFPAATGTGVASTLQWLRNDVAIPGATKAAYAPVAADVGKRLRFVVTTTQPGMGNLVRSSVTVFYATEDVPIPTITGPARLGATLTASAPAAPVARYQWYRSGVPIAGATAQTLTLAAADLGKALAVRTSATQADDSLTISGLSPATPAVGKGVIQGSLAVPTVGKSGLALTATLVAGSITETGVLRSWQWLRGGVAIPGATKAGYLLTAADRTKLVSVRVTVAKANYASVVLTSGAASYTVTGSAPLALSGSARVGGGVLTVNEPTFTALGSTIAPTIKRTWYRNGIAFANPGTGYEILPADYNKSITVTVTATAPGLLGYSASTPKLVIGKGVITGDLKIPTLGRMEHTLKLSAVSAHSTDQPTVTRWQWLRNGVVIAGATKAKYTATSLDRGKLISVRATVTRANYTPIVLTSLPHSYTLAASAAPSISGTVRVAQTVTVPEVAYSNLDGTATTPTRSYQWLRAGVVIPKATAASYTPVAADKGKALSVRVTASFAPYLPSILTTPAISVAAGVPVVASPTVPVVIGPVAVGLELGVAPREYSNGGVVTKYEWLRSGVVIPGATTDRYTLKSTDRNKAVAVRVTATSPGFLPSVSTSLATQPVGLHSFGAEAIAAPVVVETAGSVRSVTDTGIAAPAAKAYQWYRNGAAIAKATKVSYTAVAADVGKVLTVRVVHSRLNYTTVVKFSVPPNAD